MPRPAIVRCAWLGGLALLAAPLSAEVQVAVRDGRLDVTARSAPLSEVLDRMARQTQMRVTYEGAPPRQLVTATVQAATPALAVLSVLEGLGVNYALQLDATGQEVRTLLLIAAKGGSVPARPAPDPPAPRMMAPPPPIEDDEAMDDDEEPVAVPENRPDRPFRPARERMERPGGLFEPPAPTPGQGAPAVNVPAIVMPGPVYPVSPFAPVAPPIQQALPIPNLPVPPPPPQPQPDE
ncbi:MAG TPA: hypothetical protein VIG50_21075 [Vicinamibacteria bacterium]